MYSYSSDCVHSIFVRMSVRFADALFCKSTLHVYYIYCINIVCILHIKVAAVTIATWTDRCFRAQDCTVAYSLSISLTQVHHLTNSTVIFTRALDWKGTGCVGATTTVWKNRGRHWSFQTTLQISKGLGLAFPLNIHYDTIRYDTRCYFNVRSKADISQLNLPHGTDN